MNFPQRLYEGRKWLIPCALLIIALAGGLGGCLIIPLNTESGYARTNLNQQTPAQFVVGQTTRAEVILALGEPDSISRDERHLLYRTEKVMALWFIGGEGGTAGGTILKNRFYLFDFDAEGRLSASRSDSQWGMVEGTREPDLTAPERIPTNSRARPETISGTSVQTEYPFSSWFPGVDGFESKGSWTAIGRPGRLYITETNLAFITAAQFANSDPAFVLAFNAVKSVRLDHHFLAHRIALTLKTGESHSFLILQPSGVLQDKSQMQALVDFISSKLPIPTR